MAARPISIPAPTGGWNAKDPIAAMPESDAVILTNWLPVPSGVQLRSGYTVQASGLPNQVYDVMAYNGGATRKLFASSGTGIYDVTTVGGAVDAAVQTITNPQTQHAQIATPGGAFLIVVNGTDTGWTYNGTTWSALSVTGVSSNLFSNVYVTKQRVWFVEKNSTRVWYLPVSSIGGAASALDLGPFMRHGGYVIAMASWSASGGFGIQDYTVFATSEGEVLVYQGYDPSTSNVWQLQAVYKFGSPMGARCLCKWGNELLYLSKDGVTPMSKGVFFSDQGQEGNLTDKIQYAISNVTTQYAGNYGWQLQPYPLNNMLLLNVPIGSGTQQQYVMHTLTGGWCNFTGWGANCWELWNDQIYFGGNGFVGWAWHNNNDNGASIRGEALQAFSYFGSVGTYKRVSMIRPVLICTGAPGVYANINVDFDTTTPTTTLSAASISSYTFGSATFGSTSFSPGTSIIKNWQGANGLGYAIAPHLLCQINGQSVLWASTDMVIEKGSVL
jgi:hypothetical protein